MQREASKRLQCFKSQGLIILVHLQQQEGRDEGSLLKEKKEGKICAHGFELPTREPSRWKQLTAMRNVARTEEKAWE